MKKIIYVPGKNPKPNPTVHREVLWRVLLEGVDRIDHYVEKSLKNSENVFSLAAWNYEFYGHERESDVDAAWIEKLISKPGPDQIDIEIANGFRNRYDRVVYTVVDFFPAFVDILPLRVSDAVMELRRYFKNVNGVANRLREIVKRELREAFANGDDVVLIAHSMGSIISYDALWELSHSEKMSGSVNTFLTIGSPLGMNYVQTQLRGSDKTGVQRYPTNIHRWINVAATGDLVALDRDCSDDFQEMIKLGLIDSITDCTKGVYNYFHDQLGLDCHRSYGYLINPVVAEIIIKWWENSASEYNIIVNSGEVATSLPPAI